MAPTVFIGLVTHRGTRFPESSGPDGLAACLADVWSKEGLACRVAVHDTDAWTPELLPITREVVADSIDAELQLEGRWRRYLKDGRTTIGGRTMLALRRAYRRRRYLSRSGGKPSALLNEASEGFRMVRRLTNIEMAHVSLLSAGADEGSDWVLILEDDAHGDPQASAAALSGVMSAADGVAPDFANVSRSFTETSLGVDHLLKDRGPLSSDPAVHAFAASRPVTNTVCAVLYRGEFLRSTLLPALRDIPLEPVVPIDWKLNHALVNLHDRGLVGPNSCWFLRPAPIVQGSMHSE